MTYKLKTLSQDFEADDFLGTAVVSSVDEGARAAAADVLEREGLVTELDKDFEFDTEVPEGLDFDSSEYEGALPEPEEDAADGGEVLEAEAPEGIEIEIPGASETPEGVEIVMPEAADIIPEVVEIEIPEAVAFEIPQVTHLNRGFTRLKFDTFTFEEDFPRVFKGIITIIVITAAIIILLYYLLHQ